MEVPVTRRPGGLMDRFSLSDQIVNDIYPLVRTNVHIYRTSEAAERQANCTSTRRPSLPLKPGLDSTEKPEAHLAAIAGE
jgi:hypothetical protein